MQTVKQHGVLRFGAGLTLGLLVGVGMLIGALAAGRGTSSTLEIPAELLHASASDSSNTMAIATGLITDEMEGLVVLDFITGELRLQVLNSRTGSPAGVYQHNVATDLGVQQGKQPRYLLVTGGARFRNMIGGNIRPANSMIYVADANTGRYAAYVVPWNKAAEQQNVSQTFPLVLAGTGAIRNVALE